jgi:membrane protease YdiL (CAAX protease family)
LKLEAQPWTSGDVSLSGSVYAFGLLTFSVFILPLLVQKTHEYRLGMPDILLFSAMPGICAYGFFTASRLPVKFLKGEEVGSFIFWSVLTLLAAGAVTFLWRMILTVLNIPFEAEQVAFEVIRNSRGADLWKLFFGLCVFAPLIEELLFRRIVYGFLLRWGWGIAFAGTALLFSMCHFFLAGVPGLFVLGLGFQFMYLKYRNLGAAVMLHSLVNLSAFASALGE